MRGLIVLALLAAFGWSSWWWIGSSAQQTALNNWLEQQRAAGWVAEVDDLKVTGFPNRFDSILTGLKLSDPTKGWTWQAPEFQILALSYKPNHIIVAWPGTHLVETPTDSIQFNSKRLRASVIFRPDTTLTLLRLQIEADTLALTGTPWPTTIDSANLAFFAAEPTDPTSGVYDMFVNLKDITLPKEWFADGAEPDDMIDSATLDATLGFDQPWNRHTVEGQAPALQRLHIKSFALDQRNTSLNGSGELRVDTPGYIEGNLEIKAHNWRELLKYAHAASFVQTKDIDAITQVLTLVATLAGTPKTITVNLRFENGLIYLGPLPIGSAPRISFQE